MKSTGYGVPFEIEWKIPLVQSKVCTRRGVDCFGYFGGHGGGGGESDLFCVKFGCILEAVCTEHHDLVQVYSASVPDIAQPSTRRCTLLCDIRYWYRLYFHAMPCPVLAHRMSPSPIVCKHSGDGIFGYARTGHSAVARWKIAEMVHEGTPVPDMAIAARRKIAEMA